MCWFLFRTHTYLSMSIFMSVFVSIFKGGSEGPNEKNEILFTI